MYYLQTLLEECKQEIKTNEIESLCNDNLSLSSSDESHNESFNKLTMNLTMNLIMMSLRDDLGEITTVL